MPRLATTLLLATVFWVSALLGRPISAIADHGFYVVSVIVACDRDQVLADVREHQRTWRSVEPDLRRCDVFESWTQFDVLEVTDGPFPYPSGSEGGYFVVRIDNGARSYTQAVPGITTDLPPDSPPTRASGGI